MGPDVPTLAAVRKHRRAIELACTRHGASNVRVVGSVARGTATPGSDVDLLVDMSPGRSYFDLAALHDELEQILGRDVDVISSGAVRGRMASIASEAVPL